MLLLFVALRVLELWDCMENDKSSQQEKKIRILKRMPINNNNRVCFAIHKISSFNGSLVSRLAILCEACRVRKIRKILEGPGRFEKHFPF